MIYAQQSLLVREGGAKGAKGGGSAMREMEGRRVYDNRITWWLAVGSPQAMMIRLEVQL